MSFRKRNVALGRTPSSHSAASDSTSTSESITANSSSADSPVQATSPATNPASRSSAIVGTRPSPLDGRPITSTGLPDLDAQLGGYGGLVVGNSLLVAENGTTDFAGAIARCYAAEGIAQGQAVHVIGVHEQWGAELPGLVEEKAHREKRPVEMKGRTKAEEDRMRIAWRYERLGQFDRERDSQTAASSKPFPHTFDLRTRMGPSPNLHIHTLPAIPSPFPALLQTLRRVLSYSQIPVRILVPQLLSPQTYPPHLAHPSYLLPFLHGLRALLRSSTATALLTLPLSLYPRNTGLTRWIEHLSDGVVELVPFGPDSLALESKPATSGDENSKEREIQGLVRLWKIPVLSERGQGGGGAGGIGTEDLAFSISRRKVRIVPFYLPPVEGEESAEQKMASEEGKRVDPKALEF